MANYTVLNASGATASVDGVTVPADVVTATVAASAQGSIAGAGLMFMPTTITAAQKVRAARILVKDALGPDLISLTAAEQAKLKRGVQDMQDILKALTSA